MGNGSFAQFFLKLIPEPANGGSHQFILCPKRSPIDQNILLVLSLYCGNPAK
jgi:hypothetical protein